MSRTERLLALIQLLRQHRYAVSAKDLSETLDVSIRTVYRDIATLQSQGADIEGEPGVGYTLRPGFMLPPLMFNEEEIEALVLGSRWVAQRADHKLKSAANSALAKISSSIPNNLRYQLISSGLLVGPLPDNLERDGYESIIRHAMRKEYKLKIRYADINKQATERIIWPLALGYFEEVRMLAAWCELREDFRHFRTDRMIEATPLKEHFQPRRQALLQQWRLKYNIPEQ